MNRWVLVDGDKHIIVNSLDEGSNLIDQIMKQRNQANVKLITFEDYLKRDDRKRKRGKKS